MIEPLLGAHSGALLRLISDSPSIVTVLFDTEWKIVDCNEGAHRTCGGIPAGHSLKEHLLDPDALPQLPVGDAHVQTTLVLRTPAGVPAAITGTMGRVAGGILLVGIPTVVNTDSMILQMSRLTDQLTDVTRELRNRNSALELANATITALMNTDVLTDLPNRRSFLSRLPAALSFARRSLEPLSLVMADLDNFKRVNDTFGHDTGDAVLKAFAAVVRSLCRLEDTSCRFGGEEFLLLLPNTELTGAAVVAERLRSKTLDDVHLPDGASMTVSLGVTILHEGDSQDSFLRRVDDGLYEAKNEGRNRAVTMP